MTLMNEVLKRFLGKFVIVYLDDILIFSKNKEEHLEHVRKLFQILKEENLMVNLKKYYFMQEETMYLGFVISADGLKMDPEKIKAILEWPTTKNVGEVRSFHSLVSFYRKFIKNFSSICNAMIETMRGDEKEFVVELLVLDFLDFNKVFQVECDACGSAIGTMLRKKVNLFLSLIKS